MDLAERVRKLTTPYDNCALECDGLSRVLHTVLVKEGIEHRFLTGIAMWGCDIICPHWWIELPDGWVVDYRMRMWLGERAPHGVFQPDDETTYAAEAEAEGVLPDFLFRLLTAERV